MTKLTNKRVHPLWLVPLLLVLLAPLALVLMPACAGTGMCECASDGGLLPSLDLAAQDGAEEGCFMGNPMTEPELLNKCTDAEKIERPHRVPSKLWDGRTPL